MRRAGRASKEKRLARPELRGAARAVAEKVRYVGSVEHKRYPSPAGNPSPRLDASKCPRIEAARWPELTEALRSALRSGCVSDDIDSEGFPRYAWGWFEGTLYEARRLSTPAEGYKAWPVHRSELPEGAWEMLQEPLTYD